MRAAVLLLLISCSGWGPAFFDCPVVDETGLRTLAEEHDVVDVFDRMDLICEPRDIVEIDCRNTSAEACTRGVGSVVARGASFYADDATEGLFPLVHHEMVAHWTDAVDDEDPCAQHPPDCR